MRVSTSQPSSDRPLQSAKNISQVTAHSPATQAGDALALGGHAVPHAPQFMASVPVATSQPSAALALQSAKPVSQRWVHAPRVQAGSACGPAVHDAPQAPQCVGLVMRSAQVRVQHVWLGPQPRSGSHHGTQPPFSQYPRVQCSSRKHATQARVATLQ